MPDALDHTITPPPSYATATRVPPASHPTAVDFNPPGTLNEAPFIAGAPSRDGETKTAVDPPPLTDAATSGGALGSTTGANATHPPKPGHIGSCTVITGRSSGFGIPGARRIRTVPSACAASTAAPLVTVKKVSCVSAFTARRFIFPPPEPPGGLALHTSDSDHGLAAAAARASADFENQKNLL